MIKNVICKRQEVSAQLCSALMKPQLEDSSRFWVLHLNKDIGKLQERVTSRGRGLENRTYKRRVTERELLGLKGKD